LKVSLLIAAVILRCMVLKKSDNLAW